MPEPPKPAGPGIMGKVNAPYGVAGFKLPLWGWGAVGFGAWWLYRHVLSQADTSGGSADGTAGIAGSDGGGGIGTGDYGGGVNAGATNPGSILACPPGYHQERHRCVPNKQGRRPLPQHHHHHRHGGAAPHAHPHDHAGAHVHHHEKRAPLRQLPKRKRPHGTPRRVPV